MDSKKIISAQTTKTKRKLTTRLALISSISIAAVLGNLVPSLSTNPRTLTFKSRAFAQTTNFASQAQTFSLETIWRYAAAVQEINPIREEHNQEINQLLRSNRPSRVCYQHNVPRAVKQSCDLFGSKMFNILRKHNVDDVYTPISIQVKSDENLKRKIQKAGVCQQRGISLESCF